jgi:hypothetical protein
MGSPHMARVGCHRNQLCFNGTSTWNGARNPGQAPWPEFGPTNWARTELGTQPGIPAKDNCSQCLQSYKYIYIYICIYIYNIYNKEGKGGGGSKKMQ